MAPKKIFISRTITQESPIREVAKNAVITDVSLIQFSSLPFEVPQSDWIFFYSRNGVKYFFEDSNYELFPYTWACMSSGTAEELSKYVLDISFIGKGLPTQVSSDFQKMLGPNESVTFIRAENSIDSIKNIMNSNNATSIAVYNNQPKKNIPTDGFDILIFTSPMNVESWMDHNVYKEEIVIAIGETTASTLSKYKISKLLIAEEASENGIAKVLESILP